MRLSSAFDGQFYPAEPDALREVVEHFVHRARPAASGRPLGALVPHAGYIYSGRTAARALVGLGGRQPEAVILLGPSHRVPVRGVRVFRVDGYEGPMGPIPSDPELADALLEGLGPAAAGPPFPEHSVEVQLPFLAALFPGVPVVEIIYGPPDLKLARRVATVLDRLSAQRELLVVASSDLSHFYDRGRAKTLDDRFCELLAGGQTTAMAQSIADGEVEACGAGAVLTLMALTEARGGRFEIVEQTDSSEASGDAERVVGYLSALAVAPEV